METNKALKGYTKSYEVNIKNNKDPLLQLQNTRKGVESYLENILTSMKGIKYVETLKVTFEKNIDEIQTVYKTAYFNCKTQTITNNIEITETLQQSKQQIINIIAQWISEGSGWTVSNRLMHHYINIVQYEPLKGNSYIELPIELRNSSKGLINMKNNDNECFRWCHIRYLNPQDKDSQRIKKSDRKYVKLLDYSNVEFPITTKNYHKIEKQNNININVFGYEDKQPYPIYISKEKYDNHMNLLLITEDTNTHYVLIKDFNKFMFNHTKHQHKKHFCMYCLQCFSSERVLLNHKEICIQVNGKQAIKMPEKGEKVYFKNYDRQLPVPFVIYADFEAITEKIDTALPNDNKSYTEAYQKHTDCGYGYKVVCCYDDKYSKPLQIYRGEKSTYKFMNAMLDEVKYCRNIMKNHFNKDMVLTKENKKDFKKADVCHICNKKYVEKDIRVRDHCHITGNYRGSAHQDCNLNFQLTDKIPVIFHNLRGYDSHFIMQNIGKIAKKHAYKNKKGEE